MSERAFITRDAADAYAEENGGTVESRGVAFVVIDDNDSSDSDTETSRPTPISKSKSRRRTPAKSK